MKPGPLYVHFEDRLMGVLEPEGFSYAKTWLTPSVPTNVRQ